MAIDAVIEIRPMTTADIPAVAAIETVCFPHDAWSADSFSAALSNPHGLFFTAWRDDTLAGYVGAYCMAGEAEIINIAVLPEYRRQGIGAALLARLLAQAESAYLEVRKSNEAAIALYCRFGFQAVGTRKNYYTDPREDALLMALDPKGN